MQQDNPASRLLKILEAGRRLDKQRNCRECWEELLDARGDTALLMSRLGRVMELPRLTISALIASYPNQGETWKHWEAQVSAAFMVQNMHAEWKSFSANIDLHSITYLKMAADLLNAKQQSRLLEQAELSAIRDHVQAALNEVLDADLPNALKVQLSRCIKRIIDALDDYQLTGGIAVLEAAEASLGHASLDSEYRSFLQNTALGQRVLNAISAAANIVTVSVGIPQLSVVATQMLAQSAA